MAFWRCGPLAVVFEGLLFLAGGVGGERCMSVSIPMSHPGDEAVLSRCSDESLMFVSLLQENFLDVGAPTGFKVLS